MATTLGLVLVALECSALLGILALNPLLDEPIRRRSVLYSEQVREMHALVEGQGTLLVALDPVLGWRYRAGFKAPGHTVSRQGVRSRRNYAAAPPPGVLRIAAFGDSFTYGNEVDDADAWPSQLESLHPDVEVLNYGVGGYGLDQAYLRFRSEGSALRPHVALLSFVADDLGRAVNVYRRFRHGSEIPLFKPRFVLDDNGGLLLRPSPVRGATDYEFLIAEPSRVRTVGREDAWYDPRVYENPLHDYSATVRLLGALWTKVSRRVSPGKRLYVGTVFDSESDAFRIQTGIFEAFARDARASDMEAFAVFLPDRESLALTRRGKVAAYAPLIEAVRARGVPCLDGLAAFSAPGANDLDRWFQPGGHYSPAGNSAIARWLGGALRAGRTGRRTPQ